MYILHFIRTACLVDIWCGLVCFKNADFTAKDIQFNSERKLRHSFLGFCLVVSADNVAVKLIVIIQRV